MNEIEAAKRKIRKLLSLSKSDNEPAAKPLPCIGKTAGRASCGRGDQSSRWTDSRISTKVIVWGTSVGRRGMKELLTIIMRFFLAAYDVWMNGARNRFYYHGEDLIQLHRRQL